MQMNIVVLDGFTLNPGDLDWQPLQQLGRVDIYERSSPTEIAERIRHADAVLTNKAVITAPMLEQASQLKYIGVTATGYNVVDITAARKRNITVTNVPAYSTGSVAQLTFALLLELTHHTGLHAQTVRNGEWSSSKDFSYWHTPLVELNGKTMGIVGLGRIGRAVARIALAMGMRVIASHKHPERDKMEGVRFVELAAVFRESDVVSLHCPLTEENKGFVNKDLLASMKPAAFFINVSRGPLVHEQDLVDALNSGTIAGAALDVLSAEPPPANNPLLQAKNCIITPHIAWATREARERLMQVTISNLQAFLAGAPQNVVS
jgi:glycerate dehydrogenase